MKIFWIALLAALLSPASAHAASLVARDVPVRDGRASGGSVQSFDLVGLHWRGTGRVLFETHSGRGWSAWQQAAPEAEDLPDDRTPETRAEHGWRIGNPYYAPSSDGIRYRLRGDVRRLRAFFVRSPDYRIPIRTLTIANQPAIIPRLSWGANEAIRRAPPEYANAVKFSIVHHTAGQNSYSRSQSAAIVRGIELYHVQGNGWNDIGYNFLVDKYGQVFEGRYGGIDRPVIGAHAQGFNRGSVGVAVLGTYGSSPISAAARTSLVKLLAWRLDLAHVDPLSFLTWQSSGNPRFSAGSPVLLRAISGHRDTGFTDCPGTALYAQLPAIARDVATSGGPKLYAPTATGALGGPVRFTARLSTSLPWTVTVAGADGATVAGGSGTGTKVDWTWDATAAAPAAYTWTIAAGLSVRPATGKLGTGSLAPVSVTGAGASLAVFSPNGDGHDEETTVSYTLNVAATVTATLQRDDGTQVATLFTAPKKAGRQSFVFRAAGLADGAYRLVLTATDARGRQASATVGVVVNRVLAGFGVSPSAFSPNGDGRRDTATFSFSLAQAVSQAELWVETVKGARIVAVVALPLGAGSHRVAWDGRGLSAKLPDGPYRAELSVTDSLGTVSQRLALRLDTVAPRLRIVSVRKLLFRLNEPAKVTFLVNGKRIVKLQRHRLFHVPFRGVPTRVVAWAEDLAGNRGPTLRGP